MEITQHSGDVDRVRVNTWHEVNERLDTQAAVRIEAAAMQGSDVSRGKYELAAMGFRPGS
jgi:5-hydroxyisourate hydrolase-like protein (transthyretin family)